MVTTSRKMSPVTFDRSNKTDGGTSLGRIQPRARDRATIVVDVRHQESIACCRTPTPMPPDLSRLDLLQGTLDLLILRPLRSGAMNGWAVSERIQQISKDVLQVNQGSLYPALHRLEHRGWIKAEWGISELGR